MACRFNTTSLSVTNAHELDAKYPPLCAALGCGIKAVADAQIRVICRSLFRQRVRGALAAVSRA